MTTAESCTVGTLTLGLTVYERAPFGSEPGWKTSRSRCSDCGVAQGGHHHLGCDIARCPCCGWQLLSCGCRFTEYGVDELFWMQVDDEAFELTE